MRALLYAPVDLNLIDGSAIWCMSVAQTLCRNPRVHVDVLLHTTLKRTVNTQSLQGEPRIRLLDPWNPRDCAALRAVGGRLGPRLTPAQAFERIDRLHANDAYDLLVMRGGAICRMAAAEPRLASRSWLYLTQSDANLETCRALSHSNARIACQTPLLQAHLESLLGSAPDRYIPLPPMAPRLLCDRARAARSGRRICYVGKFEADYMIEEMLACFADLHRRFPDARLIVAGDKFHDPIGDGAFQKRVTAALQGAPGVTWRGDLPREDVGKLLSECDLGSCWRSAKYDASLELSTKVLEYGVAGLPVLINPSRINRLTFGDDYPLYVDTPQAFMDGAALAMENENVYTLASKIVHDVSKQFTFAEVSKRLEPYLNVGREPVESAARRGPRRVLFAGHDFKFCREIIAHFRQRPDCIVRVDEWDGHTRHNEAKSAELLRWANSVFCEWCLGAAVWYSARVRPSQRLVIRLHRQELTTDYPDAVTWDNVDHLVFIAPLVRETILKRLGPAIAPDARLVYNTVDCANFNRPRSGDGEYRLGMLGYCPKLKNPRLAVEILQRLLEHDARWRLVLTGRPPRDYGWLWARSEEREYYEQFEAYVSEQGLERALIRQDWTDDPAAWYADVDFILSCSDLEGSHQAVAEGMAAGCIPVVRRWPGAADMYPRGMLYDSANEATRLILEHAAPEDRAEPRAAARREARERFDTHVILPQLEPLLLGSASRPGLSPRAGRRPAESAL